MQKLFERCSEPQKTKMLELIAPHLASIGVHKNGTWAAQKIIDCAKSAAQVELICKYVQPYTPPLLLDQFGNYVVQCCLRLGQARNGFIFEAMSDKFWEIAQGRFGARAMRASLESQHASKIQQVSDPTFSLCYHNFDRCCCSLQKTHDWFSFLCIRNMSPWLLYKTHWLWPPIQMEH